MKNILVGLIVTVSVYADTCKEYIEDMNKKANTLSILVKNNADGLMCDFLPDFAKSIVKVTASCEHIIKGANLYGNIEDLANMATYLKRTKCK